MATYIEFHKPNSFGDNQFMTTIPEIIFESAKITVENERKVIIFRDPEILSLLNNRDKIQLFYK